MAGKQQQPGMGEPSARTARRGVTSEGAALSAREAEVAQLVADGLTNREIAQVLDLGEKTVETHLSHVFSKLGISAREAVAVKLSEVSEATE